MELTSVHAYSKSRNIAQEELKGIIKFFNVPSIPFSGTRRAYKTRDLDKLIQSLEDFRKDYSHYTTGSEN